MGAGGPFSQVCHHCTVVSRTSRGRRLGLVGRRWRWFLSELLLKLLLVLLHGHAHVAAGAHGRVGDADEGGAARPLLNQALGRAGRRARRAVVGYGWGEGGALIMSFQGGRGDDLLAF